MYLKILHIAFIILVTINGISQSWTIRGQVIDSGSKSPIGYANIIMENGKTSITDSLGIFKIEVDSTPIIIRITHVSYEPSVLSISDLSKIVLLVPLKRRINKLDEIQISARRLRILTEKDDFSLSDFEFDNTYLWMLGYQNNQSNQCRLFLANEYGDTLTSKPLTGAQELFKDVFGNVHLILKDSCYQLFSSTPYGPIELLYPLEKQQFSNLMNPILAGFSGKLVYKYCIPSEEKAIIYYYDETTTSPQLITIICDSLEAMRKRHERTSKIGSMWIDFKRSRYWKANTKISQIYEGEVSTPMFSVGDSLFIINLFKDSLLMYNEQGELIRGVPISFHKDSVIGNIDYKNISFLIDSKSWKTYVLERKSAGWSISLFDTNSGKTSQPISIPDFAGLTGMKVFNNAVYFQYHEKRYPYYTRLFRYQL